jgi:hypothetical protein
MGSMRGMGEEQADHGVGGSRLGLTLGSGGAAAGLGGPGRAPSAVGGPQARMQATGLPPLPGTHMDPSAAAMMRGVHWLRPAAACGQQQSGRTQTGLLAPCGG